jgi:putative acetyltransferase
MCAGEIAVDDPRSDDVRALLRRHFDFLNAQSPPEDVHALDIAALTDPDVTFLSCRRDGELVAVGAVKRLTAEHGELKSMHTTSAARGSGIGKRLVEHLISVARDYGWRRVSLETGPTESFAPARALYARAGFVPCGAFGDYRPSVNSMFMTLELSGPDAP